KREERRRGGAPGSGGERARWHPLDAPASVGRRGNERVFRLGRRSLARHRTTGAPHGEPVPTILPVAALRPLVGQSHPELPRPEPPTGGRPRGQPLVGKPSSTPPRDGSSQRAVTALVRV